MIDIWNKFEISDEQRRHILNRALRTNPYFYRMTMPFDSSIKQQAASSVLGIGKDFYLTEVQTNLGAGKFGAERFNMSLYTGWNRSLYRYATSAVLPQSFIATEGRELQVPASGITRVYDDRQRESLPFLIRQNDKVYCEIKNPVIGGINDDIEVVLKGFQINNDSQYLDAIQTRQISDSLSRPVKWEIFKIDVPAIDPTVYRPLETYVLESDNISRLILGFGVTYDCIFEDPGELNFDINITELTRRLRLCDSPIPLGFIAPAIPTVQDTNMYYLPIEYYFQPYSRLQFEVKRPEILFEEVNAQIVILTRTV